MTVPHLSLLGGDLAGVGGDSLFDPAVPEGTSGLKLLQSLSCELWNQPGFREGQQNCLNEKKRNIKAHLEVLMSTSTAG